MTNDKHVVLIVDDIPSNIQALAAILKDQYIIKVATSGKEALEVVTKEPVADLILLDVEMPEMDGYETCEKLKSEEETKHIPVIFVTGHDSSEDEEKGLNLGAVDYITKPVNPAITKARVKTHLMLKQQNDELRYTALHDKLTGLYNRHFLMDNAKKFFSCARRENLNLTVVVIDIDHFKKINDTYGHQEGDNILSAVAKLLIQNIRKEDFIARYGGEEFIGLFLNASIEKIYEKMEHKRVEIENLNPNNISVTASFGITSLNETHETFDMVLKEADQALYEAKHTGRNKCVVK